jgi:hypothetical protein
MRSRNIPFVVLHWFRMVLPLAALLAGSAIAAPPSQDPDTDGPYAGARGGFADGGHRAAPLSWNQLNPQQRAFLKPLRSQWDQLPPWRQQHMAANVEKWQQFPPERQAQIQQRITRWAQMTPQERFQAARGERAFQAMTPGDQKRVQDAYQRFQSLTPEQRRELFQKFRAERQARQGSGMNDQRDPAPQR